MSLFRIDSDNPFEGPHQGQPVAKHGAAIADAKTTMIMLHGRGATAQSMFPLADEFDGNNICYLAPQAHNHTWYPYSFLANTEKNQPGLSSGLQVIDDLMGRLVDEGLSKEKIILLGFSQGACLALEYAARHPQKLGGIIGLTGGLIGDEVYPENYEGDFSNTPFFIGTSDPDPHVPIQRVYDTENILKEMNAAVTLKIYKNMGHTINEDEINLINKLVSKD